MMKFTAGQKKLFGIFSEIKAAKGEVSMKDLMKAAKDAKMGGQFIRKLYELESMGVLERVIEPINDHYQKVTVVSSVESL